jgi:hypothetical protein
MQPPVEEEKKETPGRKEIEEKDEQISPRTYAQFQKIVGTFLKSKISHQSKTLMKKCPKQKLESFSNSTTLL